MQVDIFPRRKGRDHFAHCCALIQFVTLLLLFILCKSFKSSEFLDVFGSLVESAITARYSYKPKVIRAARYRGSSRFEPVTSRSKSHHTCCNTHAIIN